MRLLNTKSILDCDEFEEEVHNQETQDILSKLSNYPNYDCAAIINITDHLIQKSSEISLVSAF